jgi:hypothetical protein
MLSLFFVFNNFQFQQFAFSVTDRVVDGALGLIVVDCFGIRMTLHVKDHFFVFFVWSLCRMNSGASRPRGWTEEQEFELRNLFDECRNADGKFSATGAWECVVRVGCIVSFRRTAEAAGSAFVPS